MLMLENTHHTVIGQIKMRKTGLVKVIKFFFDEFISCKEVQHSERVPGGKKKKKDTF